jgi:hypothetical protein
MKTDKDYSYFLDDHAEGGFFAPMTIATPGSAETVNCEVEVKCDCPECNGTKWIVTDFYKRRCMKCYTE